MRTSDTRFSILLQFGCEDTQLRTHRMGRINTLAHSVAQITEEVTQPISLAIKYQRFLLVIRALIGYSTVVYHGLYSG